MKTMSVLAIALMAVLAYGTAEATVFVVDPTPPACVNPSGAVFFPTIGAAVAAAAAGDRIYVCPGTYPENVVVGPTLSNLTLLGIDRPLVVPGDPSAPGLQILAGGVRVQGFEVAGFQVPGVCAITASSVPVSGALVIANVVHDNFAGICFFDVGGGEIRDNTAERNLIGIADSGGGPGGPNLVIGNRTRNNSQGGIFVGSGATTRVDMNEVSGNVYGILLQIASGGVVSRNTVVKNAVIGIVAGDSSGFKIDSNTVRENGQVGIFVLHAKNCAVDENSVARNGEGIHLEDISSCQAYRNVVQQNQSIGINALDLGPGDVFVFNTASGNRVLDCDWDGSGAPTFANNRCATENPPGAWD